MLKRTCRRRRCRRLGVGRRRTCWVALELVAQVSSVHRKSPWQVRRFVFPKSSSPSPPSCVFGFCCCMLFSFLSSRCLCIGFKIGASLVLKRGVSINNGRFRRIYRRSRRSRFGAVVFVVFVVVVVVLSASSSSLAVVSFFFVRLGL